MSVQYCEILRFAGENQHTVPTLKRRNHTSHHVVRGAQWDRPHVARRPPIDAVGARGGAEVARALAVLRAGHAHARLRAVVAHELAARAAVVAAAEQPPLLPAEPAVGQRVVILPFHSQVERH